MSADERAGLEPPGDTNSKREMADVYRALGGVALGVLFAAATYLAVVRPYDFATRCTFVSAGHHAALKSPIPMECAVKALQVLDAGAVRVSHSNSFSLTLHGFVREPPSVFVDAHVRFTGRELPVDIDVESSDPESPVTFDATVSSGPRQELPAILLLGGGRA